MAQYDDAFVKSFFGKLRELETANEKDPDTGKLVYHADLFVNNVNAAEKRKQRKLKRRAINAYARKMSHRQLKRDGLYDYELNGAKYADFLPMHKLWVGYISTVLGNKRFAQPEDVMQDVVGTKLLKADYHGAFVTVQECGTPSMVGVCGIVLLERRNTFLIITKHSELKKVPKVGTVFVFQVAGLVVRLHGSQLRFRASERSVHKFRLKF